LGEDTVGVSVVFKKKEMAPKTNFLIRPYRRQEGFNTRELAL